jgi:lipid A disaccharide synthetase
MEDIIGTFARRSGILPLVASMALPMITRYFLKKASPQNASGLMSMIPSGLKDIFSDDEKKEFTTKQENVSQDEVEQELADKCFNGDKAQAQKAFQEGRKVLNEKTGQEGQGIIEGLLGNSDQGRV